MTRVVSRTVSSQFVLSALQSGRGRVGKLLVAASFGWLVGSAAHAESLSDSVALAYASNPTLLTTRIRLKILDEAYVQARGAFLPTVSASGSLGYVASQLSAGNFSSGSSGVAVGLSQPVYTSGRLKAQSAAAFAEVQAGRENLRAVEIQVVAQVVGAFLDVRRDQQVLAIRLANDEVLQSQLSESRAKFEVGQITRTDVAQSEAQAAQARALLSSAKAQLQISRANYAALVGQPPGELSAEPGLAAIPGSLDEALELATQSSPAILAAQSEEEGSRHRVAEARSTLGTSVSLGASVGYSGPAASFDPRDYGRAITATATVSHPIFSGGILHSQVRQAVHQQNISRIAIETARRQVIQTVSQSWSLMVSARANIASDTEQVKAATLAVEGSQEEYRVGLRTTLDVLITQQQLRDAEIQLVEARHDEYVAGVQVLALAGCLSARMFSPGIPSEGAAPQS